MKFSYPAIFYPEDDGRYSVIFPDLDELVTYGDSAVDRAVFGRSKTRGKNS